MIQISYYFPTLTNMNITQDEYVNLDDNLKKLMPINAMIVLFGCHSNPRILSRRIPAILGYRHS